MPDTRKTPINVILPPTPKHQPYDPYPLPTKLTAIALRSAGLSYRKIAQQLGLPAHTTVIEWCHDPKLNDKLETNEFIDLYKRRMLGKCYDIADDLIMESQTQAKLDKASTLQCITGAGILIDKAQILEGKGTGAININILNQQVQQDDSKLSAIDVELQLIDDELARIG